MTPPIIQILGLPFLACVLMSTILGYLGIHVLKREVIFIDIALAQIAAVGSIVAHLAFEAHGDSPMAYGCSVGLVLLAAGFYAFVRSRVRQISLEAIIGISYAVAAAAALFLVGIAPGGHVHIQHILSGSLLWTSRWQVIVSLLVYSGAGFCLYFMRTPFTEISNDYQSTAQKSTSVVIYDFVFYSLLGVVITLAVQTGGVVVVFAYLIIPATISAIFSSRLGVRLAIVWVTAAAGSLGGLLFAYFLDFSIGPAIAAFLGLQLIVASLAARLRRTAL